MSKASLLNELRRLKGMIEAGVGGDFDREQIDFSLFEISGVALTRNLVIPRFASSMDAALAFVDRVMPTLVIKMTRLPEGLFRVRDASVPFEDWGEGFMGGVMPQRPGPLAVLHACICALIARETALLEASGQTQILSLSYGRIGI